MNYIAHTSENGLSQLLKDHALFNRVKITRKNESKPPRDIADYNIDINAKDLPPGINIIEKP